MAWSPVNRHAAHEDRPTSCRFTQMFQSFRGIFTPIVSLMSRGAQMHGCISDRENVKPKYIIVCELLVHQWQFTWLLQVEKGEFVCCVPGFDTLFQMEKRNLLLIADFISATHQAKIVEQNGKFESTSRQTLWTECWVTPCWENAHSAAGYGRWFTPTMQNSRWARVGWRLDRVRTTNDRTRVLCAGTRGLSMAVTAHSECDCSHWPKCIAVVPRVPLDRP